MRRTELQTHDTTADRRPSAPRVAQSALEEMWFGEEDPTLLRSRATESLAAQIARIQGLRPFPVAAGRLIQVLSDPSFDSREVTAILESDPALAAKTLAVANSPLFKSRLPCRSLDHAIKRLGARNLRDVAIGVSAMSMFSDARGIGETFRDHSVGVGAVARILGDLVLPGEASTLFLAGLLHEIGKLLLIQTGEIEYAPDDEDDTTLVERERLGYDHAILGGNVVRMWRIPDPTADLVAWHHQPAHAIDKGGSVGLMVALLRAADRIDAALVKTPVLDDDVLGELTRDVAWSYADLSPGDLRQLWPVMRDARGETLCLLGR